MCCYLVICWYLLLFADVCWILLISAVCCADLLFAAVCCCYLLLSVISDICCYVLLCAAICWYLLLSAALSARLCPAFFFQFQLFNVKTFNFHLSICFIIRKLGYRSNMFDLYPRFSLKAWSKINCTDQSETSVILDQGFKVNWGYRSRDLYPGLSNSSWSVPLQSGYRSRKMTEQGVQISWSVPWLSSYDKRTCADQENQDNLRRRSNFQLICDRLLNGKQGYGSTNIH